MSEFDAARSDAAVSEAEFARQIAASGEEKYLLRLYVTGLSPRSIEAIKNIQAICETYLKGRYELEVIDIYKRPQLASGEQIIATPTLIKRLPLPLRRFVGNLSNEERVLVGLDLCRG